MKRAGTVGEGGGEEGRKRMRHIESEYLLTCQLIVSTGARRCVRWLASGALLVCVRGKSFLASDRQGGNSIGCFREHGRLKVGAASNATTYKS